MNRSDLLALADRVEAADGPERELDRAVARFVGWHRVEPRFTRNKHGAWIAPGDFLGTYSGGSPILDSLHGTDMHREVPPFTASLDAAMTLVPEGWDWAAGSAQDGCGGHAFMRRVGHLGRPIDVDVDAAAPALALTAACLRARASAEAE